MCSGAERAPGSSAHPTDLDYYHRECRVDELRNPKRLVVRPDGKFWRVLKVVEWHADGQGLAGQEEQEFFEKTGVNV